MESKNARAAGIAYVFGPYRLIPDECLLLRDEMPVALTPQAYDLLKILVESAGHLKSREELVEALWPTTVVEETNLSWNIRAVRKALGDDSETPRYIETVRGRGYRFIAPVATERSRRAGTGKFLFGKRLYVWAGTGSAIAIALSLATLFLWPSVVGHKKALPISSRRPLVAVLGFQNLSDEQGSNWIGTALAEMVGTDLAAGGMLRNVPAPDIARIRREFNLPAGGAALGRNMLHALHINLGADYVATGAYLLLGDGKDARLRVDVKLVKVSDGTAVATLSETGSRTQLFSLVRSLGVGLRQQLDVAGLNVTEQGEVRATIPSTPDAARAYSEGLQELSTGNPVAARQALEQTISLEPDFPLAYVGLAQAWMSLGDEVNARTAAKKALANSAGLARTQRLLIDGLFREAGHEWDQAVEDYRALFTFYPDDLQYGLLLARAQVKAGRPKQSLQTVASLRKLPAAAGDDPRVDLAEAVAADSLGDNQRATTAAVKAVAVAKSRGAVLLEAKALSHLGRSEDLLGKYAQALEHLTAAKNLYDNMKGDALDRGIVLERIGNTYGNEGEYDKAVQTFEEANATFARIGNRYWQGAAINNIGNVYYRRNQLSQASRYYELALPMFQDIHRDLTASFVLNNIAVIRGYQGDMSGAIKNYRKALAIRRAVGAKKLIGVLLLNLGIDYTAIGRLDEARRSLEEAMILYQQQGDEPDVSDVLASLADIDVQEDKLASANNRYLQALEIRRAKGMHNETAENERDLAELELIQDKPAAAIKLAQSSAQEYANEKAGTDEARARAVLALALASAGRRKAAREQFKLARALYPSVENVRARLQLQVLFAQMKMRLGEQKPAIEILRKTVKKAGSLGLVTLAYWARLRLVEVRKQSKDTNASATAEAGRLEANARKAGYLLVARKSAELVRAE